MSPSVAAANVAKYTEVERCMRVLLEKVLETEGEFPDVSGIWLSMESALNLKGEALIFLGTADAIRQAIAVAEEAVSIGKQFATQSAEGTLVLARSLRIKAMALAATGSSIRMEQAFATFDEAIQLLRDEDHYLPAFRKTLGRVLFNKGHTLLQVGDLEADFEALHVFDESIELVSELAPDDSDVSERLARTLMCKGLVTWKVWAGDERTDYALLSIRQAIKVALPFATAGHPQSQSAYASSVLWFAELVSRSQVEEHAPHKARARREEAVEYADLALTQIRLWSVPPDIVSQSSVCRILGLACELSLPDQPHLLADLVMDHLDPARGFGTTPYDVTCIETGRSMLKRAHAQLVQLTQFDHRSTDASLGMESLESHSQETLAAMRRLNELYAIYHAGNLAGVSALATHLRDEGRISEVRLLWASVHRGRELDSHAWLADAEWHHSQRMPVEATHALDRVIVTLPYYAVTTDEAVTEIVERLVSLGLSWHCPLKSIPDFNYSEELSIYRKRVTAGHEVALLWLQQLDALVEQTLHEPQPWLDEAFGWFDAPQVEHLQARAAAVYPAIREASQRQATQLRDAQLAQAKRLADLQDELIRRERQEANDYAAHQADLRQVAEVQQFEAEQELADLLRFLRDMSRPLGIDLANLYQTWKAKLATLPGDDEESIQKRAVAMAECLNHVLMGQRALQVPSSTIAWLQQQFGETWTALPKRMQDRLGLAAAIINHQGPDSLVAIAGAVPGMVLEDWWRMHLFDRVREYVHGTLQNRKHPPEMPRPAPRLRPDKPAPDQALLDDLRIEKPRPITLGSMSYVFWQALTHPKPQPEALELLREAINEFPAANLVKDEAFIAWHGGQHGRVHRLIELRNNFIHPQPQEDGQHAREAFELLIGGDNAEPHQRFLPTLIRAQHHGSFPAGA